MNDWDRARRIDERLQELDSMRRGWDELLGHLSMLLVNTGVWRDMMFRDLDHYATERLGLSGRAIEKRAWLERRLWDFPALRGAMRDGRLGYEKARLVARCSDPALVDAWIERTEKSKVIELSRAVDADHDAQLRARGELVRPTTSTACTTGTCGYGAPHRLGWTGSWGSDLLDR